MPELNKPSLTPRVIIIINKPSNVPGHQKPFVFYRDVHLMLLSRTLPQFATTHTCEAATNQTTKRVYGSSKTIYGFFYSKP
jgi:hypothetical protein